MSKKYESLQPGRFLAPTQLFSEHRVQEIIAEVQRREAQRFMEIDALMRPLDFAAAAIDQAQAKIVSSLLFVDSVSWKSGLKKLQDEFNSKITSGTQALDRAALAAPAEFKATLLSMKDPTLDVASQINTAIGAALGQNDGGAALRQLATENLPQISDILRQQAAEFRTDHLARDRRTARAQVHIGVRCNQLESDGITNIREMWKLIYRELQSRQHELAGDDLDAWNYFLEAYRIGLKTGDQLKNFDKQISRFKLAMKPYADRVGK